MSLLENIGEKTMKMSPAYQLNSLGKNIKKANNNMQKIYKKMEPVVKPFMYFPCKLSETYTKNACNFMPGPFCEMSKSNTSKICGMVQNIEEYSNKNKQQLNELISKNKNKFKSSINTLSSGIKNIQEIAELQQHATEPIQSGKKETVKNKLSGKNNTSKKKSYNSQLGGNNEQYAYIVNPISGRKVSIFGKKGQQVLRKFLKNLNSDF